MYFIMYILYGLLQYKDVRKMYFTDVFQPYSKFFSDKTETELFYP